MLYDFSLKLCVLHVSFLSKMSKNHCLYFLECVPLYIRNDMFYFLKSAKTVDYKKFSFKNVSFELAK